jgi:hypothetical protein
VFLPLDKLPGIAGTTEVLDYSRLPAAKPVLLGYLYGGIRSSAPRVNGFNPSLASSTICGVYLERK